MALILVEMFAYLRKKIFFMKWLRNIEFFLLTEVKMPFAIPGFFASLACFLLKPVSGACFSVVSEIDATNFSNTSLNFARWRERWVALYVHQFAIHFFSKRFTAKIPLIAIKKGIHFSAILSCT